MQQPRKMSLRQLTRTFSEYLVVYEEDGKAQVRARKFFKLNEPDCPITIGNSYQVQYDGETDVATAEVLDAGEYTAMKLRCDSINKKTQPAKKSKPRKLASSGGSATSARRQRKGSKPVATKPTTTKKRIVKKKAAEVVHLVKKKTQQIPGEMQELEAEQNSHVETSTQVEDEQPVQDLPQAEQGGHTQQSQFQSDNINPCLDTFSQVHEDEGPVGPSIVPFEIADFVYSPSRSLTVIGECGVSVAENNVSVAENNVSVNENNVSVAENNVSVAENNVSVAENNVSAAENNVSLAVDMTENCVNVHVADKSVHVADNGVHICSETVGDKLNKLMQMMMEMEKRQDRKFTQLNKKINEMEVTQHLLVSEVRRLTNCISEPGNRETVMYNNPQNSSPLDDDPFVDIPRPYYMTKGEVRAILSGSANSGNFAKNVFEKLFPELFTSQNLRLNYSYYGGGKLNKTEVDPVRKTYLEKYVLYYHPELQPSDNWRNIVVPKINESLRRRPKN